MEPKKAAFSLVELLVVIAIITMLVVLITPGLTRARSSARAAVCLSNLRGVALALNLYAMNHQGYIPYGWDGEMTWVSHLNEVTPGAPNSKWAYYICPSSSIKLKASPTQRLTNYALHGLLGNNKSSSQPRMKMHHVRRPSSVILVGDACQNPASLGQSDASFYKPNEWRAGGTQLLDEVVPLIGNTDNAAGLGTIRYRHEEDSAANLAMVDGSARPFQINTVTYGNIIAQR